MPDPKSRNEIKLTPVIVGGLTSIVVLLALILADKYPGLPPGLLGSLGLTVLMVVFAFTKHSSFSYSQRVLLIGLMIASFVIFVLFVAKHYVIDFDINVLHVAGILSIPVIVYWYLERRARRKLDLRTLWMRYLRR